ncbi:MAG: hypothetical protein KJ067_10790 [Vicinamibacteria bacterium]|nr:hypothetical protein [Vicinamibacteria bacterium]
MKLPEPLAINDLKVRLYLLSHTHPVGRSKARLFSALGFGRSSHAAFVAEILRIGRSGEVTKQEATPYGTKYTVEGELTGPRGHRRVVTVWIQAGAGQPVRLVTVRPR